MGTLNTYCFPSEPLKLIFFGRVFVGNTYTVLSIFWTVTTPSEALLNSCPGIGILEDSIAYKKGDISGVERQRDDFFVERCIKSVVS